MSSEKKKWTCAVCGSDKVQLAMWVKPNTGEIIEPLFDHPVPHLKVTAFWCDDCNEERELVKGERRRTLPPMRVSKPFDTVAEAEAFKAGIAYVGDPDVRVIDMELLGDGKATVVLEDASLRPEDDPPEPGDIDDDAPEPGAVE